MKPSLPVSSESPSSNSYQAPRNVLRRITYSQEPARWHPHRFACRLNSALIVITRSGRQSPSPTWNGDYFLQDVKIVRECCWKVLAEVTLERKQSVFRSSLTSAPAYPGLHLSRAFHHAHHRMIYDRFRFNSTKEGGSPTKWLCTGLDGLSRRRTIHIKKAGPRMSVAPPLSQGTGSVVCGVPVPILKPGQSPRRRAPVPNDYGATVTLKLLIVPGPVASVTFTANVLVVPAWVSPGVQVTLPVNELMAIGTCDVPVGVKTRE